MKETLRRACRCLFLICPHKGTGVVWIIGICQTEIIIVIVTLPFGLERLDMSFRPELKPKGSSTCLTAEGLSTGCSPLFWTWEHITGECLHPVYQRGHSKGSKVFSSLKNTLLKIHLEMCKKYRIMRSLIPILGKI